ncbi:MAG: cation diffusion facilitator family transporter [Angelakisella sp.]
MTELLIRLFVRNSQETQETTVRQAYGRLGSLVGIVVNLLLFAGKFTVGTLMSSVAIAADGVNNLSDAGSSVVSLLSFKLSAMPADRGHPYGHARIEYLASMVVAILILVLGVELGKTSLGKVMAPDEITFSWLMIVVLAISIGAKLWLFLFNRKLGKRIDSSVMQATATDSLSDVLATSAVLLSAILSPLLHYPLDGWMGVAVSAFILFSGVNIIHEAMDKLLGDAPDAALIAQIESFVKGYSGVLGVHDLIIHSYGPGRCFASLHAEVSSKVDIMASHDLMDNIEREILRQEKIHLVLHLDPVSDDATTAALREQLVALITGIDSRLNIHDFRAVLGETHNNMIFDLLVPFDYKVTNDALEQEINERIAQEMPNCYAVITFDKDYT